MKNLIEQLEENKKAFESLEKRYADTLTNYFWNTFKSDSQRVNELDWILKIQKRVLRMRHTILENIKLEATKELQSISSQQRNLKVA